jgi:hypothetical protein
MSPSYSKQKNEKGLLFCASAFKVCKKAIRGEKEEEE